MFFLEIGTSLTAQDDGTDNSARRDVLVSALCLGKGIAGDEERAKSIVEHAAKSSPLASSRMALLLTICPVTGLT